MSSFSRSMLTEGTTNRTALQIADQAAYLGVQLNATSGWEQSNVSLHAPTAQLDSETAARVMGLLRELVEEQGLTVLVATHDPAVEATGDRVVRLHDGEVQTD